MEQHPDLNQLLDNLKRVQAQRNIALFQRTELSDHMRGGSYRRIPGSDSFSAEVEISFVFNGRSFRPGQRVAISGAVDSWDLTRTF